MISLNMIPIVYCGGVLYYNEGRTSQCKSRHDSERTGQQLQRSRCVVWQAIAQFIGNIGYWVNKGSVNLLRCHLPLPSKKTE